MSDTKVRRMFRKRLKYIREFRGMTQEELAKRIKQTPALISHYECGGRTPNIDNLMKLSKALGVSTDYLLGEIDP